MKAGQGLKKSLAMRRLTQKKNDAHTQKKNSTNRKRIKRWGYIKRVDFWTRTDTFV